MTISIPVYIPETKELISKSRQYCLFGEIDKVSSTFEEVLQCKDTCIDSDCELLLIKSYISEFYGTWTEAFVTLRKVLVLARSLNQPSFEIEAHIKIAVIFSRRGNSDSALSHLNKADTVFSSASSVNDNSKLIWLLGKAVVLRYCNQFAKARETSTKAVNFSQSMDVNSNLLALFAKGELSYRSGCLAEAHGIYDKIAQIIKSAESASNKVLKAELMYRYGLVANKRGFIHEAIDYFNQAINLFQVLKSSEGTSRCLLAIGGCEKSAGNNNQALEHYCQCREIRREIGDTLGYAQVLGEIATLFRDRGELKMALDCYNQSLEVRRRAGDKYGESLVQNDMAMVYRYLGDYNSAFLCYKQSLETKRLRGDLYGQALTLNEHSLALKDTGAYDEAMVLVNKAIEIVEQIEASAILISLNNNKANLFHLLGNTGQALKMLKVSLRMIEETGCNRELQITYGALSDIYRSMGKFDMAIEATEHSATEAEKNNSLRGIAYSHLQRALISADRGIPFAALDHFSECRKIRETLEDSKGLVEVLWREATVLESIGNFSAALTSYRRSWSISEGCCFNRTKLIARLGLLALEATATTLNKKIAEAESLLFAADELEYIDGLFWANLRLTDFYEKAENYITAIKFLAASVDYLQKGVWSGGKTKQCKTLEEQGQNLICAAKEKQKHFISTISGFLAEDNVSIDEDYVHEDKNRSIVCLSYFATETINKTAHEKTDKPTNTPALELINSFIDIDRKVISLLISSRGTLLYQFWNMQFILFPLQNAAHEFVEKINNKDDSSLAVTSTLKATCFCNSKNLTRQNKLTDNEHISLAKAYKKIKKMRTLQFNNLSENEA